MPRYGHGGAARRDGVAHGLPGGQARLDPRAQLRDRGRRGGRRAAPRQHDLDAGVGVDEDAHAAGAVGAADAVGEVVGHGVIGRRASARRALRAIMADRVRSIVPLPPDVRAPFDVYVNGVRQEEGTDYVVSDRALSSSASSRRRASSASGAGFSAPGASGPTARTTPST